MSSKRNSADWTGPQRLRSVKEKLSGIVRRGGGLAKKTTLSVFGESRHERASLDDSRKAFPRVQVQDFGTSSLDIDLGSLEAFRIAPQPEEKAEQQKPQQTTTTSSSTPIADMFSKKATTIASSTAANKSSPSLITSSIVSKPDRANVEDRRPSLAPSHSAYPSSSAVSVKIINSSHAQPHTTRPWPPPETPRSAAPTRTQALTTSDPKQPRRTQLREPQRAAYVPSMLAPISTPEPIGRVYQSVHAVASQQRMGQNVGKRYSTPTAMSSVAAAPNPHLAEVSGTDRRRSWQPAPTSVPSGVTTTSAPPSASAPWRGLTNRRVSPRLGADRLAWIRELEEGKKNKSTIGGDLPVLRTMQGSVADKLARFESKQQQQQQVPLTRSNSTKSRTSSVADTFSSYGGMATTRSSLDSHRTSSVFSHYDDSFREKMELITRNTNRTGDDENEEKPALTRITSAFVPVGKRNSQAEDEKAQVPQVAVQADAENAEVVQADDEKAQVIEADEEKTPATQGDEEKAQVVEADEEKAQAVQVEGEKTPVVEVTQEDDEKTQAAQTEDEAAQVVQTDDDKPQPIQADTEAQVAQADTEKVEVVQADADKTEVAQKDDEKAQVIQVDDEAQVAQANVEKA